MTESSLRGICLVIMSFTKWSEYVVLLLFMLYLHCHHANAEDDIEYEIVKIGATWNSASQSCTLMGSERAPSFNVNIQVSYPADMEEDSPHWIGATPETTPWFKFSGCYVYEAVNEEEIKMLTEDSKFIGPVADCYLQCESHFGVNETHCFCTRDLEKGRLNGTCELMTSISFENDVIGNNTPENIDKNYHLAMYMLFDRPLKIKDDLDECLVNTYTGFKTYPCDSFDSSMRTWSKAIIESLPSSDGGRIQWTSFVRRHVMRWTERIVSGQTNTNCVSVKKGLNNKNYEKVLKPCDNKLPYICEGWTVGQINFALSISTACFFTTEITVLVIIYTYLKNRHQTFQSQSASAAQIDINPENNDNQALQQRGDQQSTSNEQASMSGSTIRSTENQRESGSNDGDQYDLPCPDGIM